jgi:hypothetical protein
MFRPYDWSFASRANTSPPVGEKKSSKSNLATRSQPTAVRKGGLMDAKYNRLIDNTGIGIFLNAAAFVLWLGAAIGLLELAVKL